MTAATSATDSPMPDGVLSGPEPELSSWNPPFFRSNFRQSLGRRHTLSFQMMFQSVTVWAQQIALCDFITQPLHPDREPPTPNSEGFLTTHVIKMHALRRQCRSAFATWTSFGLNKDRLFTLSRLFISFFTVASSILSLRLSPSFKGVNF